MSKTTYNSIGYIVSDDNCVHNVLRIENNIDWYTYINFTDKFHCVYNNT